MKLIKPIGYILWKLGFAIQIIEASSLDDKPSIWHYKLKKEDMDKANNKSNKEADGE